MLLGVQGGRAGVRQAANGVFRFCRRGDSADTVFRIARFDWRRVGAVDPFRGSWLYLLVLLEFQSEIDCFMALRILTYICLTYEELRRRKDLKAGDRLPPVLPVTIYNGQARWRAATDISRLMAPVPPPLPRYLPRAR